MVTVIIAAAVSVSVFIVSGFAFMIPPSGQGGWGITDATPAAGGRISPRWFDRPGVRDAAIAVRTFVGTSLLVIGLRRSVV